MNVRGFILTLANVQRVIKNVAKVGHVAVVVALTANLHVAYPDFHMVSRIVRLLSPFVQGI